MWTEGWQRFLQGFQLRFRLWLLPLFFLVGPGGLCVIARGFAKLPFDQGQAHHGTQSGHFWGVSQARESKPEGFRAGQENPTQLQPRVPVSPSREGFVRQETESTCPGSCRHRAARECPSMGGTPELCPRVQGTPGVLGSGLAAGGTPGMQSSDSQREGNPWDPGPGSVRGNI